MSDTELIAKLRELILRLRSPVIGHPMGETEPAYHAGYDAGQTSAAESIEEIVVANNETKKDES